MGCGNSSRVCGNCKGGFEAAAEENCGVMGRGKENRRPLVSFLSSPLFFWELVWELDVCVQRIEKREKV